MNRSIAALTAAAITLALTGCYLPGGNGFSTDTHTYESTSWQPYTITLKDTRTGQDFWSIDVPVGKQLVVRFRPGDDKDQNGPTPDVMEWGILDRGEMFGDLANSIPVPGRYDRRLDPVIRAVPELPGGMTGGGVPKADATSTR